MARLLLFLALLVSVLAATPQRAEVTRFSVLVENEFEGGGFGSGVLVEQGILTAYHVVQTDAENCPVAPVLKCTTASGLEFLSTVTRVDEAQDLALLACPVDRLERVELGELPEQGAPVVVVGSGLGVHHSIKRGLVANLEPGTLHLDARVLPGDSGCVVLNEDEQMVGMVRAVALQPPFVGYGIAVSVDALQEFLR